MWLWMFLEKFNTVAQVLKSWALFCVLVVMVEFSKNVWGCGGWCTWEIVGDVVGCAVGHAGGDVEEYVGNVEGRVYWRYPRDLTGHIARTLVGICMEMTVIVGDKIAGYEVGKLLVKL